MILNYSSSQLNSLDEIPANSQVTDLYLDDNFLTNLDGLQRFPNLKFLSCQHNQLIDLSSLQSCRQLQKLDISFNRLTSLQGLQNCPDLLIVVAENNLLGSADQLERCRRLISVSLRHNQLKTVNFLRSCFDLKMVDVSYNQLTHLPDLHQPKLHTIYCKNNQLVCLPQLSCPLVVLEARHNLLTSLDGLQQGYRLNFLDVKGNPLTSLKQLPVVPQHLKIDKHRIGRCFHEIKIINFRHGLRIIHRHLMPIYQRQVIRLQRCWFRYWYALVYQEDGYKLSSEAMIEYQGTLITRHCYRDLLIIR